MWSAAGPEVGPLPVPGKIGYIRVCVLTVAQPPINNEGTLLESCAMPTELPFPHCDRIKPTYFQLI